MPEVGVNKPSGQTVIKLLNTRQRWNEVDDKGSVHGKQAILNSHRADSEGSFRGEDKGICFVKVEVGGSAVSNKLLKTSHSFLCDLGHHIGGG